MKLLSMKIDGQDRAGILIGEEALDVTAFSEISERSGNKIAGPLADALDLYLAGIERLEEITSQIASDAALADECRRAGAMRSLSAIKLNPPVLAPGKILAVGLNYAAHAAEQNKKPPETPLIFSKCVTALIGPGDLIRLPRISDQIDYEAELAVVIGKEACSVSASDAFDYVAGYMIMNDVTARDLQRNEKQWTRAKGLDTFAPCGPWLVTADEINDPHSLDIQLSVNGASKAKLEHERSDIQDSSIDRIHFARPDLEARRHHLDRHAFGSRSLFKPAGLFERRRPN